MSRVLIIKSGGLGDNVVFLPGIQTFARRFPDWKLSILTSPVGKEIFSLLPKAPEIYEIEPSEFVGAWRSVSRFKRLLAWVREQNASAIWFGVEPIWTAYLLGLFSGSPVRVGAPSSRAMPHFFTVKTPWREEQMISQVNWKVAESLSLALGGSGWSSYAPPPTLFRGERPSQNRNLVVICPGASREYQRWQIENYVELAKRLRRDFEVKIIGLQQDLSSSSATGCEFIEIRGFHSLVMEIAQAGFFVGNNSGAMHVASALGIPSVILSGPSNPVWDPAWYREKIKILRAREVLSPLDLACQPCDRWNCPANKCQNILKPHACLSYWSVDEVEKAVRQHIKLRDHIEAPS